MKSYASLTSAHAPDRSAQLAQLMHARLASTCSASLDILHGTVSLHRIALGSNSHHVALL